MASLSDLIIPTISFAEKAGTYKNLLGYAQKTRLAVHYDVDAKSDLTIFRSILSLAWQNFFATFFTFSFYAGVRYNLNFDFAVDYMSNLFTAGLGDSHPKEYSLDGTSKPIFGKKFKYF